MTTQTATETATPGRRARAFQAALSQGCTATAYTLDGSDYIVTSGTGEGYDFAYDADDIDIDVVSADDWDYSSWCASGPDTHSDIDVAVAYYMQTGRVLGEGGACVPALTEAQIEVLSIARRLA